MLKELAPVLVTVLHLAAFGGCKPDDGGGGLAESTATVHLAPTSTIIVSSTLDEVTAKDVPVTGRDRQAVPDTEDWWCGNPLRSTTLSNVMWLELLNTSGDTLGLSVELEGLTKTHPKLYVYAEKKPPLHDCVTFALHRKLAGASAIILEPTSSAYVLVSTGSATGVYTLSVKTDHVITQ